MVPISLLYLPKAAFEDEEQEKQPLLNFILMLKADRDTYKEIQQKHAVNAWLKVNNDFPRSTLHPCESGRCPVLSSSY